MTEPTVANNTPVEIPTFEGEQVVGTKAKITSVAGLEVDGHVWRMDDSVKLVIDTRVLAVHHEPNAKGELQRVHILKAIDSLVIGWDLDLDALREALDS